MCGPNLRSAGAIVRSQKIILNSYVDDLTLCGPWSVHSAFWAELRKWVKLDPSAFIDSKRIRIFGHLHSISPQAMSKVEYAAQVVEAYCDLTGLSPDRKVVNPSLPESATTDEDVAAQGQLHEPASKVHKGRVCLL